MRLWQIILVGYFGVNFFMALFFGLAFRKADGNWRRAAIVSLILILCGVVLVAYSVIDGFAIWLAEEVKLIEKDKEGK